MWNLLIRLIERIVDKLCCTVFENLVGIMNYAAVYHHEHPMYSRLQSQTAESAPSVQADPISAGDVVLYSGGSFMDYIYLTEKYSPVFCTVARDEEGKNDQVVALGWLQLLFHAIGLKFPKAEKSQHYPSLEDIIYGSYVKRVVVILVEVLSWLAIPSRERRPTAGACWSLRGRSWTG